VLPPVPQVGPPTAISTGARTSGWWPRRASSALATRCSRPRTSATHSRGPTPRRPPPRHRVTWSGPCPVAGPSRRATSSARWAERGW